MKKQSGFTLIELLAVLGVIVTVGTIAAGIIISSLRITNKTNGLNSVRQNGNFAIQQISRTVQYSRSFDGVSADGTNFNSDCATGAIISYPTPVQTRYSAVRVNLFDGSTVTFSCTPQGSPTRIISFDGTTTTDLIDTSTLKTSSCYFTCLQQYKTDSPTIGIYLGISQKNVSNFPEKNNTVVFSSSINMRNSNK